MKGLERKKERESTVPEYLYFSYMTTIVETHPCCFCFPQRETSASRLMQSPAVTASKLGPSVGGAQIQ